jgi:hypothetical protein
MRTFAVIITILSFCILPGCATAIKGYYSKVELMSAPDSLRVFTIDGVELPVTKTVLRVQQGANSHKWVDQPTSFIELRSKYDHVLILRDRGREKRVQVFGEVGAGWLILGTACGLLPAAVDALTGNWNSYEPVDASFK